MLTSYRKIENLQYLLSCYTYATTLYTSFILEFETFHLIPILLQKKMCKKRSNLVISTLIARLYTLKSGNKFYSRHSVSNGQKMEVKPITIQK